MHRILLLSNDFAPAVGGIAHVLQSICFALPPDRICVLAQRMPGDAAFDRQQAYKVRRARYLFRNKLLALFSTIYFAVRALWMLWRERCDVLYVDKAFPLGLVGLAFRRLGIPFIVHTYGNDILFHQRRFFYCIRRHILRKAARVIAISTFTRDALIRLGVEERRIVIMRPKIDPRKFEIRFDVSAFKEELGLKGKRLILSVGRLVKRKGFDRVIEALPILAKDFPDVVFVLVGDGPDRERLERLVAERGAADRVVILLQCDETMVMKYYHACDVFAMPSRYIRERGDVEGFGIVFLEANACGKPVVGGNSGGVPDAVVHGETGCLCDPNDPAALADTFKRLLSDPALCARLGRQGRERVYREFALEKYAQEFAESILNVPDLA